MIWSACAWRRFFDVMSSPILPARTSGAKESHKQHLRHSPYLPATFTGSDGKTS
jgi:hypothetical protein